MDTPSLPRTAALRLPVKSLYLLGSLALVALDQWSKWLIELHLPLHATHPVLLGLFNLTHVRNTGVAFGMFAGPGEGGSLLLVLLGLGAFTAVAAYFAVAPADHRWLLTSLALILGGAVGNLVDRIASGGVTDFLDVYLGTHHWPSFNVADSAITVGIVLLAIDSFRPQRPAPAPPPVGSP